MALNRRRQFFPRTNFLQLTWESLVKWWRSIPSSRTNMELTLSIHYGDGA